MHMLWRTLELTPWRGAAQSGVGITLPCDSITNIGGFQPNIHAFAFCTRCQLKQRGIFRVSVPCDYHCCRRNFSPPHRHDSGRRTLGILYRGGGGAIGWTFMPLPCAGSTVNTHNAILIFYPQLMELKSEFPPDGGLHVQPVDNQARTGNPFPLKSYFQAPGLDADKHLLLK